jgi:hypothetical protein
MADNMSVKFSSYLLHPLIRKLPIFGHVEHIIIQHPVAFNYSLHSILQSLMHNMHPQGTAIREETTPQKQRTQ